MEDEGMGPDAKRPRMPHEEEDGIGSAEGVEQEEI